jgi:hypothetical protein
MAYYAEMSSTVDAMRVCCLCPPVVFLGTIGLNLSSKGFPVACTYLEIVERRTSIPWFSSRERASFFILVTLMPLSHPVRHPVRFGIPNYSEQLPKANPPVFTRFQEVIHPLAC